MRRNRSLSLSLLLVVLTLFSFASCSNTPEGNTGTLTIRVSDATPKMIGFEGDDGIVRMTHYGISLKDSNGAELKATDTPMPFYGDTGSFTITGLVSGSYTIDATGYVKNADGYTAIATGTTGKFDLTPTNNETKDILIDTWEEGNAESVTVEVTLPSDVLTGGTGEGTLTYRLTDVNDTDVIAEKSVSVAAGSVQDGKYTLTIPESVAPGRYVLIVGFTGTGSEKAYKAASAMLVYPNLPVTGSISLDSQSAFDGSFTVTNGLGDIIEVDGKGEYQAESGTIVVTLTKAMGENEALKWYVDGIAASPANDGLKYTFTGIEAGKRTIVGVVYNTETDAAVGEIAINVSMAEPEIVPESIFTFELNSDGKSYKVTGLKEGAVQEDPEVFEIPSEYEGLPVTSIGLNAFSGRKGITGTVIIPEGVTYISDGAFQNCTGLSEVSLPSTLKEIGKASGVNYGVFAGCSSLRKINLPEGLTIIGESAFEDCSLLENVIIPNSVRTIGVSAFSNCVSITKIVVPEGITKISAGTFYDCDNLSEVSLPSTLETIEGGPYTSHAAFGNCDSLRSIIIPDGVIKIGRYVFSSCNSLEYVFIPDSVTTIEAFAFAFSPSLESIYIPDRVAIIERVGLGNIYDIYCAVSSQPVGWYENETFPPSGSSLFWGVSRSEYDAIMNNDSVPYEVPQPAISVDAGNVTITCDKAFARIYYTTNCTEPTKDNGKLYSAPFTVSEGTTVKAVAYVGNGIYSEVATSV